MNDIKIFNNTEFGSVRVAEQNGEPWFISREQATGKRSRVLTLLMDVDLTVIERR